jgi:hypothetical protein
MGREYVHFVLATVLLRMRTSHPDPLTVLHRPELECMPCQTCVDNLESGERCYLTDDCRFDLLRVMRQFYRYRKASHLRIKQGSFSDDSCLSA